MRDELKKEKANYKESLKNKTRYKEKRDALVIQMLDSETPNWGGLKIKLSKL